VDEATLQESGSGLAPTSEGWFVVNVRDAMWLTSEGGDKQATGSECGFETPMNEFTELGFRIHVLPPGQSNGLYHQENKQEDFLVLHGECTLLVEGEERRLKQWDFFHSPGGCEHIFVGAGDTPCVILMAGARSGEEWKVMYPESQLAQRHGAGAQTATPDPDVAYADFEPSRRERPAYWAELPWA
jgi:uncharacterized cupin superfamily protein